MNNQIVDFEDVMLAQTKLVHIDLPRLPSELLALALADLEVVEKSADYVVDMSVWHSPHARRGGLCSVCMAGAVLTRHFKKSVYIPSVVGVFDEVTVGKLDAIDLLRCGLLRAACRSIGIVDYPDDMLHSWPVPMYDDDPEEFRESMSQMMKYLRLKGL